ncbi:MAG: hypothetical protein WBL39_17780 [Terrimicrobiaceae bacterium]
MRQFGEEPKEWRWDYGKFARRKLAKHTEEREKHSGSGGHREGQRPVQRDGFGRELARCDRGVPRMNAGTTGVEGFHALDR